ncbi:MAG: hypothetical protein II330_04510, partial [Clostridia bacterium]|nr:hypothetical protein [Clostridia bacterium]
MKRNFLSLLLCLCLTFAMLLPMLSACNDNSGEQNTTEQPTSEQTEEPGASGSDTHSTEPPANTNTEPADTADQTTAPDTESDTASDTESDTEFDTESDTEQGTEPPPAEQSWTLPILRVNTTDGHDVTSKEHYKTCTVTLENCSEPMQFADVTANIRVRGNSTAVTEKKPFRLKFDKKRNMLGLNDGAKCKSW